MKYFSFKKSEIDQIFKNSKLKARVSGLKLLHGPTKLDYGKILIVIPASSGKAVERNKFKRRVKSIFYEEGLFQIPVNWVLLAYKDAMGLSFEEIKKFLVGQIKSKIN